MTREEASNILDDFDVNFAGHTAEEIAEAFDVAFKALSQESKTGHWINRHIIANKTIDMIVCSECSVEFSYDAETGVSRYNYCPNCGAKMLESPESEGK